MIQNVLKNRQKTTHENSATALQNSVGNSSINLDKLYTQNISVYWIYECL